MLKFWKTPLTSGSALRTVTIVLAIHCPIPSQFLALSAHGPECHIEHNVLKNALCFIMWYLVAMAIRVMLLLLVRFFIWYIVQVKSMCVPILRSIGSELTKLENMQKCYVLFDIMWRKNGTSYVMATTTLLIGILTRNILKPTKSIYDFRFKSYGSNSGFRVFGDLDLWPMFYFFVTRIAHDVLEYPCVVS